MQLGLFQKDHRQPVPMLCAHALCNLCLEFLS